MSVTLHRRAEVGSTNDEVLALARAGAPSGTAVCARAQTQGRGRLGRDWHSPDAGNVYLSLLHRPTRPAAELAGLTLDLALAVARILDDLGVEVGLKWPNDLVLGGRKLAGILTELHLDAGGGVAVIVGIGLNVNAPAEAYAPPLDAIATSLRVATGRSFDLAVLEETLAAALHVACVAFDHRGVPETTGYLTRCVSLGRRVRVSPGGATGVVCGVAPDGALLVRFDDRDDVEPVRSGVVEHLPDPPSEPPCFS
ncbi:MAG: biotin--[acetyl-CoA-carboxylase] ligase [Deltaproteobacteria bacterium]|nr:MAG: biotin--[acetyl-CoA-carboxylase] ligase [Deltaproteobacteria bacterium]